MDNFDDMSGARASHRPVRKVSAVQNLRELSRSPQGPLVLDLDFVDKRRTSKRSRHAPNSSTSSQHNMDHLSLERAGSFSHVNSRPNGSAWINEELRPTTPTLQNVSSSGDKRDPGHSGNVLPQGVAIVRPRLSRRPTSTQPPASEQQYLPKPTRPETPKQHTPTLVWMTEQSPNMATQQHLSQAWRESHDSGYYSIARSSVSAHPKSPQAGGRPRASTSSNPGTPDWSRSPFLSQRLCRPNALLLFMYPE